MHKKEKEQGPEGPYFFLFVIKRFMIHAIINAHTITSPNTTMPAAPIVPMIVTVTTVKIINMISNTINKHILHYPFLH